MNIEYYILNPAGNITALVTTAVQKESYKFVADRIMSTNPSVEQVGFVNLSDGIVCLNMSGDEFCGNATMCAAALKYHMVHKTGPACIYVRLLPFENKVGVNVTKNGAGYLCEGLFLKPKNISKCNFSVSGIEYEFPCVVFSGITHVVADKTLSEKDARSVIKQLSATLRASALGIMIYDGENKYLKPLVYVPNADTLILENSCASGSCAVSAVLPEFEKMVDIVQPGGIISVQKDEKNIRLITELKIAKKCIEEIDYA